MPARDGSDADQSLLDTQHNLNAAAIYYTKPIEKHAKQGRGSVRGTYVQSSTKKWSRDITQRRILGYLDSLSARTKSNWTRGSANDQLVVRSNPRQTIFYQRLTAYTLPLDPSHPIMKIRRLEESWHGSSRD